MVLVPFDFTLHQRVCIKEIETHGVITAMIIEDAGKHYRVCYWHDGIRSAEWVLANEIESLS